MLSSQVLETSIEDLELTKLKQKLHLLAPLGEITMSPELNQLRSDVLDTWGDSEIVMEELIAKKLFVSSNPHRQGKYQEFKKLVFKIFKGMTWMKKLDIVLDLEIISDELYFKLKQLNQVRVCFAHSASLKYKIFNDEERQLFAYKLMTECIEGLAIEDEFFGF